jgi:hypothetical protein
VGAPTNALGPHRDADPVTDFDDKDDIDLVDLKIGAFLRDRSGKLLEDSKAKGIPIACYWGPHYLINTTMNLVGSDYLAWRDRKAEAFCLSPLFCGSKSTGFARVTEETRRNLTLGRAIATSGAAVDPNMYNHQSAPMTALLTLFNARLGIWIQNPLKASDPDKWDAGGAGPGTPLIEEFLGMTTSDNDYVHLSDGGHFENLGVYELLRRRCRYVVAVDAPEDDNATSGNLGNLVSKARIDLGIRIHIDTAPLKLEEPQRYSRTHVVIGQILYDDVQRNATPGILVYIRASMTGDEPPDVQQYRNDHKHFPYESTVNQFFGEEQFESYRALGFHIAVNVFEDAASELKGWLQEDNTKDLAKSSPEHAARRAHARLFAALHSRWIHQPSGDGKWYADSTRSFVELQRTLRDRQELSKFARELYPELGDDSQYTTKKDGSQSTAKKHVRALHLHEEILQLVGSVWLGLGLDRRPDANIDRGWMNSLRRLTSTPSFRRSWPLLRAQYNIDFQRFCERLLRLDADDPRLESLTYGQIVSTPRRVQIVAAEFAREWPDFVIKDLVCNNLRTRRTAEGKSLERLGKLYLDNLLPYAAYVKLDNSAPWTRAAWLIIQPPKHHVPAQEPSLDFIVGILIIAKAKNLADGFDLFYWIRPAHRSSGIGQKIFECETIVTLLDQDWSVHATPGRKRKLRVRYPETRGRDDDGSRRRWLNFFALYDFKPENDLEPGKEWVLVRDLRKNQANA